MKKVEAPTLEEAYTEASKMLECSISELHCEVVQHPSKGIFGFLKKNAIIMAKCKHETSQEVASENEIIIEDTATEILSVVKEEYKTDEGVLVDSFVENKEENTVENEEVFEEDFVYDELALLIENQLKELFSHACFDIDVIEVDVRDNTALIFIDGEDAALLIGKEGYRYNALSYMLFSWLHTKYELFIKLEIAEFLTKQEEMIRAYIKPLIESVENTGRGKTHFLDGILVQIALEQLREAFPNKYVAVKTSKDGKKFVVINDFNTK